MVLDQRKTSGTKTIITRIMPINSVFMFDLKNNI